MPARQLSDAGTGGTVLGQSATDLIGFFGKTARIRVTAIQSISSNETTANVKTRLRLLLTGMKNLGLVG